MVRPDSDWVPCHMCNRGGRGNDKDLCSSGWRVTTDCGLGCFLGTPIIGTPREPPKVSRSKARYMEFMRSDSGLTFREWLGIPPKKRPQPVRRGWPYAY